MYPQALAVITVRTAQCSAGKRERRFARSQRGRAARAQWRAFQSPAEEVMSPSSSAKFQSPAEEVMSPSSSAKFQSPAEEVMSPSSSAKEAL